MNPHTVIEVGREDPDDLFVAHHAGANPGEEYYRPACCLLWAAGSGKVYLPLPRK